MSKYDNRDRRPERKLYRPPPSRSSVTKNAADSSKNVRNENYDEENSFQNQNGRNSAPPKHVEDRPSSVGYANQESSSTANGVQREYGHEEEESSGNYRKRNPYRRQTSMNETRTSKQHVPAYQYEEGERRYGENPRQQQHFYDNRPKNQENWGKNHENWSKGQENVAKGQENWSKGQENRSNQWHKEENFHPKSKNARNYPKDGGGGDRQQDNHRNNHQNWQQNKVEDRGNNWQSKGEDRRNWQQSKAEDRGNNWQQDRRENGAGQRSNNYSNRSSPNADVFNKANEDFHRRNDNSQQRGPQRRGKFGGDSATLPRTFEESESGEFEAGTTMVIQSSKAAKIEELGELNWRDYTKKLANEERAAANSRNASNFNDTIRKQRKYSETTLRNAPTNTKNNHQDAFDYDAPNFSIPLELLPSFLADRAAKTLAAPKTTTTELSKFAFEQFDFKNISWSEEKEEEEAARAAELARSNLSSGRQLPPTNSDQQQRGLLTLPATQMNQLNQTNGSNNQQRKPKGRGGQRPIDPDYVRGPPQPRVGRISNNFSVKNQQLKEEGQYQQQYQYQIGRGSRVIGEYDTAPRPGSQASAAQMRETPPPSSSVSASEADSERYARAAEKVETRLMPMINECSVDIKEQSDLALRTSLNFDLDRVLAYRQRLQDLYRDAVLVDVLYSYRNNLEHRMWKGAFYDTIEILRSFETYRNVSVQIASNMRGALFRLLDAAREFYSELIRTYETKFQFKLENHLRTIDDSLSAGVKPVPDNMHQMLKYALLSCQRFEVALGDVERYREQLKSDNIDYKAARLHYLNAVQLAPSNGRPYNQLALLAQYTKRRLDMVFYYFRSLSVKHSFETAKDSIKAVFEEQNKKVKAHELQLNTFLENNRRQSDGDKRGGGGGGIDPQRYRSEVWTDVDGRLTSETNKTVDDASNSRDQLELDWFRQTSTQMLFRRFQTYFLHLHGMLFAKINMDQFETYAEKCLIQFRELLSRDESPLTPVQIVQIAVICFYSVHHSAAKELERGTCSLLQHNAVQLCLSVFGLLLERLEALYVINGERFTFDANLHLILPALRLFSVYLCNPDAYKCLSSAVAELNGIDTTKFSVSIWPLLANVCNIVEHAKSIGAFAVASKLPLTPGVRLVYFPEDYSCSPMFNIFHSKMTSVNIFVDETEMVAVDAARLNSISELGLFLDGAPELMSVSSVLTFDGKKFTANNAGADRSSSPVGGGATRRRRAASDDENEKSPAKLNGVENAEHVDESDDVRQLRLQKRDEESKMKMLEQEPCRLVLNICPKFLIPDTNSFIDHLTSIKRIYDSNKYVFYVPITVMNELIGLKKNQDSDWVSSQAKEAVDYLEACVNEGKNRCQALTIDGNPVASFQYLTEATSVKESNDDRILKCCSRLADRDEQKTRNEIRNLKDEPLSLYRKFVLLTDDRNVRVKALAQNIPVRTVPQFVKWSKV